MKLLLLISYFGRLLLLSIASVVLFIPQILHVPSVQGKIYSTTSHRPADEVSITVAVPAQASFSSFQISETTLSSIPANTFGNPAGCETSTPAGSVDDRLTNVQRQLGDALDLAQIRQNYIWNGPFNTMVDVADEKFAFEFVVNQFQPPYTYRADEIATIFLNNGFVVWFRAYDEAFRLLAVPIMDGVYDSAWGQYVHAYWQMGGMPNDNTIQPVTKKLPCRWVVEQGFVSDEQLQETFNFDWNMPDYASEGRKFLASTCADAFRVAEQEIGYWDVTSICGPLTWRIVKDSNSFPYRIGNWYSSATLFTQANPRWNGRPWIGFDPDTYDLISTDKPMMGYDFANNGNLYSGDIVYSYSTLYVNDDGRFDHIFMVTGIDANGSRSSITNMVQNAPTVDCFIGEVTLYTPGDLTSGVINYEWNDHGYGTTGSTGFDVLRWKWITYHLNGQAMQFTVRWGDTIETIAFDWKISPQSILDANQFQPGVQLTPGQVITLPTPVQ